MQRAFIIFAAVFLITGCSLNRATAAPTMSVLAQWSGPHSGSDTPAHRLVRSQGEWSDLWMQLGREAPHRFDAARETALVVFLGQRPTAGYAVEITEARESESGITVFYREKVPDRDQSVAQMLTTPWAVALIPATSRSIEVKQVPRTTRAR